MGFRILSWFERFALINTDIIISNLPNFPLRIEEVLGREKEFIWLPKRV